MSEIKVNKISPRTNCGTVQLGDSGDTITIPSGATISNSGTASGFGSTGEVSWNTTVKTGDFTAVSGEGYFINTTSGEITMTLPSSPSVGAIVAIKDYANTFDTNKLIINRNGQLISGDTTNPEIITEGQALTLVYGDATKGWQSVAAATESDLPKPQFIAATGGTITTVCTNFKVHTFTGPGTFEVTNAGNPAGANTVSYVVVGGGGGSGRSYGGGGGAGGYRESKAATDTYTASPLNATSGPTYNLPVSVQSYPIVVGAGGAKATPSVPENPLLKGSSSSFSTITSTGGGGGGHFSNTQPPCNAQKDGQPGGSGGGGADGVGAGGSGNTPPVSPPQGNNGGTSQPPGAASGGGGAGAGGEGGGPAGAGSQIGGDGGAGVASSINGTPTLRAGGGGGYGASGSGAAGPGGGGAAGNPGAAGTANTGGGGGGTGTTPNPTQTNTGGSGIVIIRYKFQ